MTSITPAIVSIGDRIFSGEFSLHSKFRRAANFTDGETILAVVAEEIGRGPVNIVVRGVDLAPVRSLRIDEMIIRIGRRSFPYDRGLIFSSRIRAGKIEKERLILRLQYFEEALLSLSPPRSLVFLFDPARQGSFKTSFEKNFAAAVRDAAALIFPGGGTDPGPEFMEGIRKIKGVGFGLTPSGDDFIAGLLAGLNLLEMAGVPDLRRLRERVCRAARSGNLLSNSFITLARDGFFFERFHGLISSLLRGDKKQVRAAAGELLAHGETSGSDMAVGFLLTLKFFASGKKFSDSGFVGI